MLAPLESGAARSVTLTPMKKLAAMILGQIIGMVLGISLAIGLWLAVFH
jgi:hypothetical protein